MAVTGKLARVVLFLLIFPHFPPSAFSPPSPSCSLSHFLSLSLWPLSAWPTGAQPVVCFSTHSAWHVHVWWLARLLLASIYFPSSSLATTNNIWEKHIKFTSSSPTLSCCHPSPSMCLWLEILGTFWVFFVIMEFVWYFYFWLHASVKWFSLPFSPPPLSILLFSCHLSGPQIYWHDMSKCSVCTLCISFFLMSTSITFVGVRLIYFNLFSVYILVMG